MTTSSPASLEPILTQIDALYAQLEATTIAHDREQREELNVLARKQDELGQEVLQINDERMKITGERETKEASLEALRVDVKEARHECDDLLLSVESARAELRAWEERTRKRDNNERLWPFAAIQNVVDIMMMSEALGTNSITSSPVITATTATSSYSDSLSEVSSVSSSTNTNTTTTTTTTRRHLHQQQQQRLASSCWSLPGRAVENVFSYLEYNDLARCEAVCRSWHRFFIRTHIWQQALERASRAGPRDYVLSASLVTASRHHHYSLSIEVSKKEQYNVKVDAVEIHNDECELHGPPEEVVTHKKKARQLAMTICEERPGALEPELNFCRNVVALNSQITHLKMDNARLASVLSENEGTKAILQRRIQEYRRRLDMLGNSTRDLTQQLSSDEVTIQFLRQQLVELDTDIERRKQAHADELAAAQRALDDHIHSLRSSSSSSLSNTNDNNDDDDDDAAAAASNNGNDNDVVRELKAHKSVLAREIKNLRVELQRTKDESNELKAQYRQRMQTRE